MKLGRLITVVLTVILLVSVNSFAQRKKVNINFKKLEITSLIKLTSKILHKNILLTRSIKGKVDFISSKEVYEDELLDLVQSVLASKGYTLVENKAFMEVVRLSEASKYNLPVVRSGAKYKQMVTKSILLKNADVNTVAAKVRHLISKSAKLITVRENNSILITDFPKNIETVEKIIKAIEQDKEKQVIFIKLKNIKVQVAYSQIVKISKDMFNPKIAEEKVTMISNRDSNSLVLVGYKKSLSKLTSMIQKFDQKDPKLKQEVRIISLKNTEAKNTFKAIQFVIKSKKYTSKEATPTISVDADTNSLIVLGPKESIDGIEKIIKELDKEKPQVYVKAQIIEVNENLADKIGIKYGLEAGAVSGSGLFNLAANLGGSVVSASTLAANVKLNDSLKDGLILGATIDFLKENYVVNVVSEPSLLCINNKESSIYVGETKSIQTGTETTSGGNTINKYSREDIGLTLKVKPLISNDNKVTLDITTVLEDVQAAKTNGQPDTSKKEIKTVALVRDGENVIIGGLIKNKIDKVESKVPLLGDIPIFGAIFKHKNNVKNKINLVIILTPYIVETSSDLTILRNKLSKLDKIRKNVYKDLKIYLKERENNVSN